MPWELYTRKSQLIIAIAIFLTYALLYERRYLDVNLYASWSQIFRYVDIAKILVLIILALLAAYATSAAKVTADEKFDRLIIFLIAFFIGALFWNAPEINQDTARYFTQAKYLEKYGIASFMRGWGNDFSVWTDFPVVPFLYGLIFRFIGEARLYTQLFTTVLLALSCVLTYSIGKMLWGREAGVYAGLILASFPFLLIQAPLMLLDIHTMFFVALTAFMLLNALEKQGRTWIIAAAVSTFLAFFSKASAVLMLVPIFASVIFIKFRGSEDKRHVLNRSISIIFASAALIASVILLKYSVFMEQLETYKVYQTAIYARFSEPPLSLFLFQTSAIASLIALFSLAKGLKNRDAGCTLPATWLLFPLAFLYYTRARYMIPAFPAIALGASASVSCIRQEKRRFIILGAVFSSLVVSLFAYLPYEEMYNDANLKNAGEYANTLYADKLLVYTVFPENFHTNPNLYPAFLDLYTDKEIIYSEKYNIKYEDESINPKYKWSIQYRIPAYYNGIPDAKTAVVIISHRSGRASLNELEKRFGNEYRLEKTYTGSHVGVMDPYFVKIYVPK